MNIAGCRDISKGSFTHIFPAGILLPDVDLEVEALS